MDLSPNDSVYKRYVNVSKMRSYIVQIITQYANTNIDITLYKSFNSHVIQALSTQSRSKTRSKTRSTSRIYSTNYLKKTRKKRR
jgi:hypothetical protein